MLYDLLTYPLRAWHRKGYDVQSPWAFSLVCDVLFERHAYYAYDELRLLRQSFITPWQLSAEADEQLFRIANHFAPKSIVEIGLPQSACYMARPHTSTPCTAVLPNGSSAVSLLEQLGIGTATGNMTEELRRAIPDGTVAGLVHVALADTPTDASMAADMYEWVACHAGPDTVLVMEHINSTNRHLWRHIVRDDERATVTFDLGSRGMVTFDTKRVKQDYLL